MANEAAVDFLEQSRHQTLNTNFIDVGIARHNLEASVQNAVALVVQTDAIRLAMDSLLHKGEALFQQIGTGFRADQEKVAQSQRAFEIAFDQAVEVIRQARPNATALALGI